MSPSTTVAERVRGNRYQALHLPLCRAAASPCPAYRRQALIHRNINRLHRYPRPAQAQRRRARTAGAEPLLCRAAASPCPAYITQALICFNIKPLHRYPRPAQAQRRRARTAGAEPLLCRAAATPCPAYITQALI
ncbi:hypothetical protein AA608_05915 [Klebsiella pneumoniae]|nr:hypothetical protein [Klebsiella pneumoniae]TBO81190.1 hypothetical protein EXT98_15510 [Klebsiella pneumoniae]